MDQHLASSEKEKPTVDTTQRSLLQITDRRDSASNAYRTLSPVAFFHDGYIINRTDVQKSLIETQRRAQAIATAPRRKRYDDDDDDDTGEDEAKKTLLRYIKTSALPIPITNESSHPHSLPQIESGTNLLPTFRVDPPSRDDHGPLEYPLNSRFNRCPSAPLPSRNLDWKDYPD